MPLAILAASALLLTLLITPACRTVSRRLGWVDHPDPRKLHRAPIPRTGGIAIFLAYAAALILVRFILAHSSAHNLWTILPALLVAFATGLFDDLVNLKPWTKVAGQVLAAILACAAGIQIRNAGGYSIENAWWHIPLTVLWLVGCANAFNLIDGLDGLATGVGIFATATAFLSALLSGNVALAVVTAPLLGALLGFLPYNFNPASIFMGDCGSNTVGFLLGCAAIVWWRSSATFLATMAPLIALAIPLLDTVLAIARRSLRHQPIFGADRGHIHHRLLARGFSPRRVACTLYAVGCLLACLSILLATATSSGGFVLGAFCLIVWLGVRYLGYDEFDSVRRILFGGAFRRVLSAELTVFQLETVINSAHSVDECWAALRGSGPSLGLSHAAMQVHGRNFTAQFLEASGASDCWSLSIPLNGADSVDLRVPFHPGRPPTSVAILANSLRMVLAPKLETLRSKAATGIRWTATGSAADVGVSPPPYSLLPVPSFPAEADSLVWCSDDSRGDPFGAGR